MCRRATSSEAAVCSHHRTTLVATVLRVAVSAALAFVGRFGGLDTDTTTTIPRAPPTHALDARAPRAWPFSAFVIRIVWIFLMRVLVQVDFLEGGSGELVVSW